jgi:hypothetical protein
MSDFKHPKGWYFAGAAPDDYEMGVDPSLLRDGKPCAVIRTRVEKPSGFGTLMQTFKADDYVGRRVCLSGWVKTDRANRCTLWMRVDGEKNRTAAFDNMHDRPIQGTTDWQKYEVVLDVPELSIHIAFGMMLDGPGVAWLNKVKLKKVSKKVPTTGQHSGTRLKKPYNLSFEE